MLIICVYVTLQKKSFPYPFSPTIYPKLLETGDGSLSPLFCLIILNVFQSFFIHNHLHIETSPTNSISLLENRSTPCPCFSSILLGKAETAFHTLCYGHFRQGKKTVFAFFRPKNKMFRFYPLPKCTFLLFQQARSLGH